MSKLNLTQSHAYAWLQEPGSENRRRLIAAALEAAKEPGIVARATALEEAWRMQWIEELEELNAARLGVEMYGESLHGYVQTARTDAENARKAFEAAVVAKDFIITMNPTA